MHVEYTVKVDIPDIYTNTKELIFEWKTLLDSYAEFKMYSLRASKGQIDPREDQEWISSHWVYRDGSKVPYEDLPIEELRAILKTLSPLNPRTPIVLVELGKRDAEVSNILTNNLGEYWLTNLQDKHKLMKAYNEVINLILSIEES